MSFFINFQGCRCLVRRKHQVYAKCAFAVSQFHFCNLMLISGIQFVEHLFKALSHNRSKLAFLKPFQTSKIRLFEIWCTWTSIWLGVAWVIIFNLYCVLYLRDHLTLFFWSSWPCLHFQSSPQIRTTQHLCL